MDKITDEEIEAMAEKARKEVSTEFILKNEEEAFDLGFEYGFKERDKLTSAPLNWDDILEEYSKEIELSVEDVRYALIPFLNWLKKKYPVSAPLEESKEIENLKNKVKWQTEKIMGDFHYIDSLLGTNRELGERISELEQQESKINKAIDKAAELYYHYKSLLTDDAPSRYFAGARDAMTTMKQYLLSIKREGEQKEEQ